jgi:hypothetical protein
MTALSDWLRIVTPPCGVLAGALGFAFGWSPLSAILIGTVCSAPIVVVGVLYFKGVLK